MIMTSFLKNRRSVREFKRKKVKNSTLEKVEGYLEILEEEELNGNVRLSLYENGSNLYKSLKGLGGYAGVMIESPHYISLGLKNMNRETIIYSAYYMEYLITKLNELGLDTCWISIGDVDENQKKEALGEGRGEVNYLLAIGFSKPKNPFVNEPESERIGVEELVYKNEIGKFASLKELEERGLSDLFYYVRFAPSARNKQPWRFLINDNKAVLLLKDIKCESLDLMDAGIIMYYFEQLARTVGINDEWEILGNDYEIKNPNYEYIAEIKL